MNLALHPPGAVVLALTTQPPTLVILVIGIVVAVVLVVLAAVVLARWWVRRHQQPAGTQPPVEAPELYDLRTADVTDDIRFCVDMARSVGGPVLELGAGTGRVTLPMARTGLVVTGLETSRLMLQRARLKAEQLSARLHVEWVEGDITNFSLGGRKFRLILAPFHVLQELRDLNAIEQCLRCVAEHLEPTGKFVLMVQPPRWENLRIERRFLKTVYNPRTGEVVNCYQSLEVDPIWQKLRGDYEYEIWDHEGHVRQIVAPYEGSFFACRDMALLLRAAGLQIETIFGSFERDKLTATSKQMIFVAQPLPAATPQLAAPVPLPAARTAAKAPALAAASASAAAASMPPPALAASPATIVLPESKDKAQAAPAAASADTPATLPTLPAPDTSGSARAAPNASAQRVQLPAPPPGRQSSGQRRPSRPRTPGKGAGH